VTAAAGGPGGWETFDSAAWKMFRRIAQDCRLAVFVTDTAGRHLFVNRRWCELTGMDADEALGWGWERAVHSADLRLVTARWRRLITHGESLLLRIRLLHPDGTAGTVTMHATATSTWDGQRRFVGTLTALPPDPVGGRTGERAGSDLGRSRVPTPRGVPALPRRTPATEPNPPGRRAAPTPTTDPGHPAGSGAGSPAGPPSLGGEWRAAVALYQRIPGGWPPGGPETPPPRADDPPDPPAADSGGCLVAELGRAEQACRDRERWLTTLLAELPTAVLLADADGRVVAANQAYCDLFELTDGPVDLVGTDARLLPPLARLVDNPTGFAVRLEALLRRRRTLRRETVMFSDGRVFERSHIPLTGPDGYRGHLWLYVDVTDRRILEAEVEGLISGL
jgi:PAS domain S-box-containing protein